MTDENTERERAYRFDLFVAPDWCERFDQIVRDHVPMPTEGQFLEINCGTGSRTIAIAESIEEGEVVGVASNEQMLTIANAKAEAARCDRCTFVVGDPAELDFEDESFDGVVADVSLSPSGDLAAIVSEAVRVARADAPIAVKVLLRGSFDEFYSLYWQALYELEIVDEIWPQMEPMILVNATKDSAIETAKAAGLKVVDTHDSKEEWRFDTAEEFLASPLVNDLFLDQWLSIVPDDRRDSVRTALANVIDRERAEHYFDISAKALVIHGTR